MKGIAKVGLVVLMAILILGCSGYTDIRRSHRNGSEGMGVAIDPYHGSVEVGPNPRLRLDPNHGGVSLFGGWSNSDGSWGGGWGGMY